MPKPRKPYPTFPLTPHVRGGWSKKYKGSQLYISERDPDQALEEFHRRAREIDAGQIPTVHKSRITLDQLAEKFMSAKDAELAAGKITLGWHGSYDLIIRRFLKFAGGATPVADLTPDHFSRFLASRDGEGIDKTVQCVRTWFNVAIDQEWCEPVRLGNAFRKRSRKERASRGKPKLFHVAEVGTMLDAADHGGQLQAMILLAINGGLGQTDCATLPAGVIDLRTGVIDWHRGKTGIRRVVPLWPQTLDALRPLVAGKAAEDRVFLTRHGRPWVREKVSAAGKVSLIDSVNQEFGKLLARVGIWETNQAGRPASDGRSFYTLRRTFRTIADEQGDQRAIALVMGHHVADIGGVYVQHIGRERLDAVVAHVWFRLMPEAERSCVISRRIDP